MNKQKLKKAVDQLSIDQVLLKSSKLILDEQFLPRYDKPKFELFLKRRLRQTIIGTVDEPVGDYKHFVVFIYEMGIRLSKSEDTIEQVEDEEEQSDEEKPSEFLLQLEANYSCHYWLKSRDIDDECLHEFGTHNVPYHAWPYWREHVQSTLAKCGVDNVSLPFYSAPNQ